MATFIKARMNLCHLIHSTTVKNKIRENLRTTLALIQNLLTSS